MGGAERLSPRRRSPPRRSAEPVCVKATTDVLVAQALEVRSATPAHWPLRQAPANTPLVGWAMRVPVTTSRRPSVTPAPLVRGGGHGAGFHTTCPAAMGSVRTLSPSKSTPS